MTETIYVLGEAIEKHPELAREIVRRGHEPAAHGKRWQPQYTFPPETERAWIQSSLDSIVNVTGQHRSGYDCYWMRGSVRTLGLLQELGFTYHNNDLSRDEPFTQDINSKPFVSVPYTIHMTTSSRTPAFRRPTTSSSWLTDIRAGSGRHCGAA